MMGRKARVFGSLPPGTLEDLVPQDHFYRHLERTLDLGFVRDLVRDAYAETGRPSIDPVVFFKLQLVMFFEGIRSERQLMEVVADRLSLRWYLGYDLHEPLPDHSSLTRIRERYGPAVFRRFFEAIVAQCVAAAGSRRRSGAHRSPGPSPSRTRPGTTWPRRRPPAPAGCPTPAGPIGAGRT